MRNHKPRQVLWTGGFDSTFRVYWLLLVEQIDVQPIYVIDTERRSTMKELETIGAMQRLLRSRAGARLWPMKLYDRHDYTIPEELERWFQNIALRTRIGTQYLWLAAVAEHERWNEVELGMERYPDGPSGLQKFVFRNPPDSALGDHEEAQLFRYWSFPILHLTKTEMLQMAVENGFSDILSMRWFCFNPIGNRACGRCRPSHIARRDHMTVSVKFAPWPVRWFASLASRLRTAVRVPMQ